MVHAESSTLRVHMMQLITLSMTFCLKIIVKIAVLQRHLRLLGAFQPLSRPLLHPEARRAYDILSHA